eukprot:gb/GEZN01015625.1/.p1 GENE.gb/GEZN01015625.1/~~gb/GEZN01015625.1/.p1  ORF type:complete len:237 (-),score=33.62 gb/GEZN01015625.1/:124-834(-)
MFVITVSSWLLTLSPLGTMAIEEPAYRVVRHLGGNVELRQYAPYVVAEVRVAGSAESAGSKAFPILAGYIFGKNKGDRKLQMGSPVTQAAVPKKLAMTAPVTQQADGSAFIVEFVLPRDVTLETAPEPLDPRVKLRAVAPGLRAAIRYSGFWSDSNNEKNLAKLKDTLQKNSLSWTGEPMWLRYDPPYVPWFMRRNEIWVNIEPTIRQPVASRLVPDAHGPKIERQNFTSESARMK